MHSIRQVSYDLISRILTVPRDNMDSMVLLLPQGNIDMGFLCWRVIWVVRVVDYRVGPHIHEDMEFLQTYIELASISIRSVAYAAIARLPGKLRSTELDEL